MYFCLLARPSPRCAEVVHLPGSSNVYRFIRAGNEESRIVSDSFRKGRLTEAQRVSHERCGDTQQAGARRDESRESVGRGDRAVDAELARVRELWRKASQADGV